MCIIFLFLAECVDIQALKYISTDQISELLSKYPLGVKIKFNHYVKEWRKKRQLQVPGSIITSPSVTSSYQQVLPFSVYEVLNKSSQGALITNYYKTNNNLNESCRNLMIDIIISYLVEHNISMTVNLADTIATTISETFISELKVNKKNLNINYPNIIYFYKFIINSNGPF